MSKEYYQKKIEEQEKELSSCKWWQFLKKMRIKDEIMRLAEQEFYAGYQNASWNKDKELPRTYRS